MSITEDSSFQLNLDESSIKKFGDFSMKMLDRLLPNWRNYEQPQSYIIPPKFIGLSTAVVTKNSNGTQESLKRKSEEQERLKQTDLGESAIFEAIQTVISENTKSPFIAFYNLNMNNAKNQMSPIFPEIGWNEKGIFRDYDFILIGPEIGVIIIEVKRSMFKQKRHFLPGTRFIPDEYRTGISELESSLGLLEFVQECTGIPWQGCVCKVIFTPHLEKARFEAWIDSLDNQTKEIVMNILGQAVRWFKDDMIDNEEEIEKPSLYTKVRQLLEEIDQDSMSRSIYESYGALLAGFASVAIKKSGTDKKIHLDEKKLIGSDESLQGSTTHLEGLTVSTDDISPQKRFKTDPKKGSLKLTDKDLESINHVEIPISQEGSHNDSMVLNSSHQLKNILKNIGLNPGTTTTSSEIIAKASTNRKASPGKLEFVGPAQTVFSSFLELARFSLDTYCPDWNNVINPASYILPPTFSFKNADKSDEDMEMQKRKIEEAKQDASVSLMELACIERPIIDRVSDSGEFVVFQALWKLIQEKIQAPYLVVRAIDLNKLKRDFQEIFPHLRSDIQEKFKEMMREYDFVLIGPRIGIIVIEVKSSAFTKKKDFSPQSTRLPDNILDGIRQLSSFNLEFLTECTGFDMPYAVPLRKILFTPNLEKHRFDVWCDSLNHVPKDQVDKYMSGAIHFFRDDMVNFSSDSMKPALYSSIREMIEANGFQLPMDIYEAYGPILVGIGSAVTFQTRRTMELTPERLSSSVAILRDAAALYSHDPRRILDSPWSGRKRSKIDVPEKGLLSLSSKLILLTPEQRAALNGPNRQFIIGAAGTGKTIILQAKALEMLNEEKSVLVFSTSNFCQHYRKLFDDHGYTKYIVRSLTEDGHHIVTQMGESVSLMIALKQAVPEVLYQFLSLSETDEMLSNSIKIHQYDAVFIDDAIDDAILMESEDDKSKLLGFLLATMAFGKSARLQPKMIWIALDPYLPLNGACRNFYRRILEFIMQERDYFSCSCLQQVMRCSQSVFQAIYTPEVMEHMALKPVLGHKVHGFYDSVHLRLFQNDLQSKNSTEKKDQSDHIQEILWKEMHQFIKRLCQDGFDYGQMAVIIGSLGSDSRIDEAIFCMYISNKCRQCGIPNVDAKNMLQENGRLVIDVWHNVSSLEWPVVIFTAAENKAGKDRFEGMYQLYRACSRATMKLFQIICS